MGETAFGKRYIFQAILLFALLPACSFAKETNILHEQPESKPICTDWAKHTLGKYEITNNVWGKGNIHDYSQCIYGALNPQSDLPQRIGWSWNWPNTAEGVKAYPSILYGKKPWNDYSTTSRLPRAINQLSYLNVSFEVNSSSNGAVNLLLESWVTKTAKATPGERVGEVAIQLYQKNWPGQAGRFIESVVIDNIAYDFYIEKTMHVHGDKDTWVYYGFVHNGEAVLQVKTLDMMKFINYLVKHGYLNRKHYVASVELGNEIDHGEGRTEIKHFSVQVGR